MSQPEWVIEVKKWFPWLFVDEDSIETTGILWIELSCQFESAYAQAPINEFMIRNVYEYADWCIQQSEEVDGHHLPTIVCTHFYEHIPESDAALADMPRWFSRADVLGLREVFSYHGQSDRVLRAFEVVHKRKRRSR